MMKTFKQHLIESKTKFKGTYNWYGEIILKQEYTTTNNKDTAHKNFCNRIAKKLKRSINTVINYYNSNQNSYKIEEV